MVAVVGVDAQLVDELEVVLAPVLEVDQHEMQRGSVLALEVAVFAQALGGLKDIGADDLIAQAGELGIGERNAIEGFELLAEVLLERGLVADVGAIGVFQRQELVDQFLLDLGFFQSHPWCRPCVLSLRDRRPRWESIPLRHTARHRRSVVHVRSRRSAGYRWPARRYARCY